MAIDISNLLDKTDNNGSTPNGRLTSGEWKQLVQAVQENQKAVNGTIKGVTYNGTDYKTVDENGMLIMNVLDITGRDTKFDWIQQPLPPNNTISKGGSCIVEFSVIDRVKDENDASQLVPYYNPGKVTFYVDDKQVGVVNNVYSKDYPSYTGPVKFDFGKAAKLSTKAEGNSLKVEYVNNGVIINKIFTVYVLDLSIDVENFKTVYTSEDKPDIYVVVRGSDSKIYASVDDDMIVNGETSRDGIRFNIKDAFETHNQHGTHTFKTWASPIGYENVVTDTLTYNYIYGNTSSTTPIVMSTITDGSEFELYGKVVVDYVAYLSGENGTKTVDISITDVNENPLLTTSQSIEFINGRAEDSYVFTLFPIGEISDEDLVGTDKKLVISMEDSDGMVYKHITNIIINPSTVNLKQKEGYHVYLSSNGRSNSESNDTKRVWKSVADDGTNAVVDVTFDDNIEFINTGSGWIADADGNMAMHLKKGRFFTLNYAPFKYNPTYNNNSTGTGKGLTISIEFATRNCLNANAKVIDCMDYTQEDTGRGFYVTASEAKLLGSDIELGAKFKEDTRIKLDLVIEGALTKYTYDTVVGTDPGDPDYIQKGESDECLALMFIDGVYTGITLITKDTSFQQGSSSVDPKFIRFGSNDCDLDIYNIRIYDSALNIDEIVQNYSYDTPAFADKIAISQRNDIFATAKNNMPSIDVGKLRKARPELPFFYVDLDSQYNDKMPDNKSDWKLCTMTQFQNPKADSGKASEAKTSWEADTGVLRNQGTSSMTYPWPWRNWDWKTGDSDFGDKDTFKYYFPDITNTVESGSKWHQYDYNLDGNNLPIKKITLKKDYASSEMCNNAICSEIFTDMALGIGTAYPNALSPAMKADITNPSTKKTDYRLSLKAMPCFMFQTLEDPNAEGTAGLGVNAMGMMNLIPNKNEVGYLGFKKNKWENADEGITAREQSWELGDNLDDVFWVKKLDYFQRNSDGTFKNSIKDLYEARTPKDSSVSGWDADFGFTPKNQATVTLNEANIVRDETTDIIDFHNWLVATNQHLADDSELKTSRELWNDDGTGKALYTHNTKEYRKAKFRNEANDRLILDQWILYYIWREQFWMFDSGFKNLQVYTVGTNPDNPSSSVMQWGCMVRDADTALGIENTGKDYFPPHIEDIDYYTESNGKITFYYGGAEGIYDITELETLKGSNAKAVLNGQFGSIWVNIRDCFGAEIASMYRTLTNNVATTNFSAGAAINKFRSHQEHWCESLYNFGMRQYFGGAPFSYFNKSALGDKKNSRAQWLDRGFYYRRGKYRNLSDGSAFRVNTYETPDTGFNKELTVKTYIPMYIGVGGTTAEMLNSKNVIRMLPGTYEDESIGKPISVGEDGFNFPSSGDAVSYMYGTSMITDIGDLARVCKILRVQGALNFPKLRELNLGHEPSRDGKTYKEYTTKYIENENGELVVDPNEPLGAERPFTNDILPNLDCSALKQLTLLDVTNHTNLSELNIKECTQLQKLYARGTIMKSLDIPATTSLNTLYLGNQLTSLDLINLTGLADVNIDGLDNCGRLFIQNCGDYMGKESYNIMLQALSKLESVYDPVTKPDVCSFRGVNWNNATYDVIERLCEINADITGYIKLKGLPNAVKVKLIEKYGPIDDPKNPLHIEYTQEPIKTVSMPSKLYLYENKDYQLSFNVTPTTANTYKSAYWQLTPNSYATVKDSANGIISRNELAADETKQATLTVTIKQLPEQDGTERDDIVVTSTVYFYERTAKPGDIVFNDGSFSDELDPSKTPIGVCFYVDPADKTKRLMCALQNVTAGNSNTWAWGLYAGGVAGNDDKFYYGSSPYINFDGEYPGSRDNACYNIANIVDITNTGMTQSSSSSIYYTDADYRDSLNVETGYFKAFDKLSQFGDLGWKYANNAIKVYNVTLPDGSSSIEIAKDESVPSGYYNTLAIIAHRNRILEAYRGAGGEGTFEIPAADRNYSELERLSILLNEANSWAYADRDPNLYGNTYGSTLYYPAASACFAYEPNGVVDLADKFKKYNWFLPASGDMIRILYYYYQSYAKGSAQNTPVNSDFEDANAFANAIALKVLSVSGLNNTYNTSTERDMNYMATVDGNTGYVRTTSSKYTTYAVRPICRF